MVYHHPAIRQQFHDLVVNIFTPQNRQLSPTFFLTKGRRQLIMIISAFEVFGFLGTILNRRNMYDSIPSFCYKFCTHNNLHPNLSIPILAPHLLIFLSGRVDAILHAGTIQSVSNQTVLFLAFPYIFC